MWNKFIGKITYGLKWFFSSLDTTTSGASGRKLTAMVVVGLIIQGHQKWVDKGNYSDVDFSDKAFVCILLGIVTIEQVIKLFAAKSGQVVKEETTTSSSSETTVKTKTEDIDPKI